MNDVVINKMFDTSELNRLQRCAKNKDKKEIIKWGQDFEHRLAELYHKRYKDYYLNEYKERLKDLDVAMIYALHFNEETHFENDKLTDFMNDLSATMRGFYKDNFTREDYVKMLKDDGVKIEGDFK